MGIQASKACHRAENACGQNKRRNKARHVSKKESHFLRPTLTNDYLLASVNVSSDCRCRLCGVIFVDMLKHKRKGLSFAARLPSIVLNFCLVPMRWMSDFGVIRDLCGPATDWSMPAFSESGRGIDGPFAD
jgi:hypothetical protein